MSLPPLPGSTPIQPLPSAGVDRRRGLVPRTTPSNAVPATPFASTPTDTFSPTRQASLFPCARALLVAPPSTQPLATGHPRKLLFGLPISGQSPTPTPSPANPIIRLSPKVLQAHEAHKAFVKAHEAAMSQLGQSQATPLPFPAAALPASFGPSSQAVPTPLRAPEDDQTSPNVQRKAPPKRRLDTSSGPSNIYQTVAAQIGNTHIDPDGDTYKEFTTGNTTYRGQFIGAGQSFGCYRMRDPDQRLSVFKVFNLSDSSTLKRLKSLGHAMDGDARMATLKEHYNTIRGLGVPCAEILNPDSLQTDGFIHQQYTPAIEASWAQKTKLEESESAMIGTFCDLLGIAMLNHGLNAWELGVKNFGQDEETKQLKLFDFGDAKLGTNQWQEFRKTIRSWIAGNNAAKALILERLENTVATEEFAHLKFYTDRLMEWLKDENNFVPSLL